MSVITSARTTLPRILMFGILTGAISIASVHAQQAATAGPVDGPIIMDSDVITRGVRQPEKPVNSLDDSLLRWPLLPQNAAYGAIDGKVLHGYVRHLSDIARRYRDNGHPQFWGRIIGTAADHENAQWIEDKFKEFGLSDVHQQEFELEPQWMPQSWEVTATSGLESLGLPTAHPVYRIPETPDGLELELVYVGTGAKADFLDRDVRGKAAVIFSMPFPGSWRHTARNEGAFQNAQEAGAAAIFSIVALPGNVRTQLYPSGTTVPTYTLGMSDGYALRDMIGDAPPGHPATLSIRMNVNMEPDRTTSTVWGTVPGTTDENIYILAHRDGWFDAGTDNASGVATMLGLAEYFASVPQAQRKRNIVFIGTSGHHNSANVSGAWLLDNQAELFEKTALFINAEHTSTLQTYLLGHSTRQANMATGLLWYAGGPSRPRLRDMSIQAFREFGVATYAEPEYGPSGGEMSRLWPYVPGLQVSDYNMYFHSDHETPESVAWTGLESVTRAYAKIIDGVNELTLEDLQRTVEETQRRR